MILLVFFLVALVLVGNFMGSWFHYAWNIIYEIKFLDVLNIYNEFFVVSEKIEILFEYIMRNEMCLHLIFGIR